MVRFFLNTVFFFFCLVSSAQSGGYLGKRNYAEIKVSMVPSYRHQNVIKDDLAIQRWKYANLSYRFTVSRVLTKNFDVSLGYEFASMNCISNGSTFIQTEVIDFGNYIQQIEYEKNFLDDPKLSYHGAQFAFNFYRLGSLAPIGKFIGFSMSYGIATLAEGEPVIIGKRGVISNESFFKTSAPIGDSETYPIPVERKTSAFHLKARIGRNYPISDRMMVSVGLNFPLLSKYTSGASQRFGFNVRDEYTIEDDSDWGPYSMITLKAYNRVSIDAGIRFHF